MLNYTKFSLIFLLFINFSLLLNLNFYNQALQESRNKINSDYVKKTSKLLG